MILISTNINEKMLEDATHAFPNECCGFLFGIEKRDTRFISEILIVQNNKEGDQRRRFEIAPKDYMKAEQFALSNHLQLLGIYHSHPNHPAVPSEHDRVAAQPFFSYVIVAVYDETILHQRSWRLNEEQQFEEEKIAIESFS